MALTKRMKLPYKIIHSDGREVTKANLEQTEYCCETMRSQFGQKVVVDTHRPGVKPFIGVKSVPGPGDDGTVKFDFCPFCGTEIEYEKIGEFENMEVRIDT